MNEPVESTPDASTDTDSDPDPDHPFTPATRALDDARSPHDSGLVVITQATTARATDVTVNALGWTVADIDVNEPYPDDDPLVRGVPESSLTHYLPDDTRITDLTADHLAQMRHDPRFPAQHWYPISRLEELSTDVDTQHH